MIAKGERPSYRLVIAQSGFGRVAWSLIAIPSERLAEDQEGY